VSVNVVVDIGNSRIKWGRCTPDRVAEVVSLAPEDVASWEPLCGRWRLYAGSRWVVAGVHPRRRDHLAGWLRQREYDVVVMDSPHLLPLKTCLEFPEQAGIDRLLNAVAANSRRRPQRRAIIVDAGSAVTVDVVDGDGVFRGGAILPGLRLMSQALHAYTALLPLVEVKQPPPPLGTSTAPAIQAGVFWAVVGGIQQLLRLHRQAGEADIFLTGGDARVLASSLEGELNHWPEMTLEGVRLAALHQTAPRK
jgi:type III pantothenate kinase